MKIIRIYNNNILAARMGEEEVIITGNGVGFGKNANDDVDETKIEKTYTFQNQQNIQVQQFLERIPAKYFRIAEMIVDKATTTLAITLSNQILISLTDHINYAIERKRNNQQIPNLMFHEIKISYKSEFKIGLWALRLIEANTNVLLDEDEAGYIAMHIVNATIGNKKNGTNMILRFMKDIQCVIEKSFCITLDQHSLNYTRLVTHLKYLAQHIFYNDNKKIENLDELYDLLITHHVKMKSCIEDICLIVKKNYNYQLEKYELVYLMIHMSKLTHENE